MFGGPFSAEGMVASLRRMEEIDRRMKPLTDGGMSVEEAHMRVFCQIEAEERDAHQQRLLADIRENGT
jgi:hypothetical protein